jgi:hypothetical protein
MLSTSQGQMLFIGSTNHIRLRYTKYVNTSLTQPTNYRPRYMLIRIKSNFAHVEASLI